MPDIPQGGVVMVFFRAVVMVVMMLVLMMVMMGVGLMMMAVVMVAMIVRMVQHIMAFLLLPAHGDGRVQLRMGA